MLITRFFLSPFWRWWSCLPELFSRVRSLKAHARALLLAHTRSLALAALKKTATNLTNDTGDRLGFLDRADTMKWLNWLPPRCTSPELRAYRTSSECTRTHIAFSRLPIYFVAEKGFFRLHLKSLSRKMKNYFSVFLCVLTRGKFILNLD